MALLRLIAQDLRDYASGELQATPDALRRLAAVLDDICTQSGPRGRPLLPYGAPPSAVGRIGIS